jgi:hypothetical protein
MRVVMGMVGIVCRRMDWIEHDAHRRLLFCRLENSKTDVRRIPGRRARPARSPRNGGSIHPLASQGRVSAHGRT